MIGSEQEKLILKYLSNNATAKELDILSDWILDKDNAKLFQEYTQLHLEIITSMNGPDTDKIKKKLLQKIKRDKIRKKINSVIKYAAVGLLIFSLGNYFQQEGKLSNGNNALIPKEEAITIILGNGKMETLKVDEIREVM
jgi:transmembrane sensor